MESHSCSFFLYNFSPLLKASTLNLGLAKYVFQSVKVQVEFAKWNSTKAESFGVGEASGFTWKQYLDSMACVECGLHICVPAQLPKKHSTRRIIHHLKDAMLDADAVASGTKEHPKTLIGEIVTRDELWACTTCGACMEACPLHIEHILQL